jgi:hypothetical protein
VSKDKLSQIVTSKLSLKKLVNGRIHLGRAGGFFRPGILILSVNLFFYLIDQAEGILGSIVADNFFFLLPHQSMFLKLLGEHDCVIIDEPIRDKGRLHQ